MHEPTLLLPPRRGQGTLAAPWRWSGRFHLSDVNGTFQATLGAAENLEADLWDVATDTGVEEFILRILPAGRDASEVPRVVCVVQKEESRIICRIRGGRVWGLSYLLGMVLPARALVTVEAYDGREDGTSVDESEAYARAAHAQLETYLHKLPVNASFCVREVIDGRHDLRLQRALADAAQRFVGRGVLETKVIGRRRFFILRRLLDARNATTKAEA